MQMTQAEMYRDYLNNFGTVERFASFYHISVEDANTIINQGRKDHKKEEVAKSKF